MQIPPLPPRRSDTALQTDRDKRRYASLAAVEVPDGDGQMPSAVKHTSMRRIFPRSFFLLLNDQLAKNTDGEWDGDR